MWSLIITALLLASVHAQITPDDYCAYLLDICPSQFARDFGSDDACLSFASFWESQDGDQSSNTIDCRDYHIELAEVNGGDESIHCFHAGINGGGVCGSYCDNYCFVRSISNGTGCAEELSVDDCTRRCEALPDTDPNPASNEPANKHKTSGNSIQCRIYHAAAAYLLGDSVHCLHSSFSGANVCGGYCENYCYFFNNSCSGDEGLYESEEQCMRACSAMNVGTDEDTGGPSVQCRLYHIGVAVDNDQKDLHCPHARFRSAGETCGDECEHLCEVADNYCVGVEGFDFTSDLGYGNQEDCVKICQGFPVGDSEDTTGNSLACRNYHIDFGVLSDAADVHCPHAGVAGSDTCGDWCNSYCSQSLEFCPENYEDMNVCLQACEDFAGIDTDAPYVYSAASADDIQCRIYHVGAKATTGNNAHCDHSSIDGGGVCIAQPTEETTQVPEPESSEPAPEPSEPETDDVTTLIVFIFSIAVTLL